MLSPSVLLEVERCIGNVVKIDDLERFDWRRQTDVLKEVFMTAAMIAELGDRAVLIDGNIATHLMKKAYDYPGGVKRFFNRRCHDYGIKTRRLIVYDTVTTRKMGTRGSSRARLHIHAVFERSEGQSIADLKRQLTKVYGQAGDMQRRQFDNKKPDWTQHYTFKERQAFGPIGKLFYALAHAGTTYKELGLNGGKRSRKAPACRRADNRNAKGLARGIPSNFNSDIVFADDLTKRAGSAAFTGWVKLKRTKQVTVPAETTAPVSSNAASYAS